MAIKILSRPLLLIACIIVFNSSCNKKDAWEYTDIIDPDKYVDYFQDLDLLEKDLKKLDYTEPRYGNITGTAHSTYEKYLVEYGYSHTVILKYKDTENKSKDNVVALETWITTSAEEQATDRFKIFIEKHLNRLKKQFTKRLAQKSGDGYKLILGGQSGTRATISNELKNGNQFIVTVDRKL